MNYARSLMRREELRELWSCWWFPWTSPIGLTVAILASAAFLVSRMIGGAV